MIEPVTGAFESGARVLEMRRIDNILHPIETSRNTDTSDRKTLD